MRILPNVPSLFQGLIQDATLPLVILSPPAPSDGDCFSDFASIFYSLLVVGFFFFLATLTLKKMPVRYFVESPGRRGSLSAFFPCYSGVMGLGDRRQGTESPP